MAEYKAIQSTLRTFQYPFTLDGAGGLKMAYGVDVVENEIRSALETFQFERIMRPRYGLPQSLVFSAYSNAAVVSERIRNCILNAVNYNGFSLNVSTKPSDDGAFNVQVNWSVNQTPQPPIQYRFTP